MANEFPICGYAIDFDDSETVEEACYSAQIHVWFCTYECAVTATLRFGVEVGEVEREELA